MLGASLVAGSPRLALLLGRPVAATSGQVRPAWREPAAFVRPGRAVTAPVGGRLDAVAAPGPVATGAVLARLQPAPPRLLALPPFWAGWAGGAPRPRAAVAQVRGIGALLCGWRGCSRAASPGPAPASVAAPADGWFTPAWDPLALTSLAADSDLPPGVLAAAPLEAAVGRLVPAGTVLGILGSDVSGRWLVALPQTARPALVAAGSVEIGWGGHALAGAQYAAGGPAIGGRFLAVFTDPTPGVPEPPARTRVLVELPPADGTLVPATAVRVVHGVAVLWRLVPGNRIVRQRVQVLGTARGRTAVHGLAAGARVLSRPWLLARLVAKRS